ncbi:MAG TPA: hypothetical protein VJN44_01080, partial [Roseateles sp.]|nr:hypothetical protein [Roseateles sp.]
MPTRARRARAQRPWTAGQQQFDHRTREQLRGRRWLRVHVFLIAATLLALLWSGGALLRLLGVESLAWRYALLLPGCYLAYLGLLRLWAAYLLSRDEAGLDGLDLPVPQRGGGDGSGGCSEAPFESGGGGDFGGGASSDF